MSIVEFMRTNTANTQNRPLCYASNKTLGQLVPKAGFGEAPQQAFSQARRDAKISSVATLELLAKTCIIENAIQQFILNLFLNTLWIETLDFLKLLW